MSFCKEASGGHCRKFADKDGERRGMKKNQSKTKWMLEGYMHRAHIESFPELAKESGIEYRNLMNRIKSPGQFRLYEIQALDEILKFEERDLMSLIKGEDNEQNEKIALYGWGDPVGVGDPAPLHTAEG